jgi:hypothetical protein
MLNRRTFIKTSVTAGMAVMTSSILGGCSGLKRSDFNALQTEIPQNNGLNAEGRKILYYASLAPSGHNTQPWRVRIEKQGTWIIEADPDRRLPIVDPLNRELLLSIGAFVENLVITAASLGYRVDTKILAQDKMAREILHIGLHQDTVLSYPLQRMELRRTVRHGQLPKELDSRDVRALSANMDNSLVYFPKGSQHADCIAEAAIENFRIQSQRDAAQRELVKWLRLNDTTARKHRDGLTAEGMEITGFKGWIMRKFIKADDFMKPSFRQQGIDMTAELAHQGAGWFIISSPGQTVADLINTGRRFERMALLAREHHIAIHPMTQILEETHGQSLFAKHHDPHFYPQFILRVGYLDQYPQPVSLRRPVDWFVYT